MLLALLGNVPRRVFHREASEGGHGEVPQEPGGDQQRHQDKEPGKETALLQHVPRQNTQQCCCLRGVLVHIVPKYWLLFRNADNKKNTLTLNQPWVHPLLHSIDSQSAGSKKN